MSRSLLPQSALTESRNNPALGIRPTAAPQLTRTVVLVKISDRLLIPVFQVCCQLVLERGAILLSPPSLSELVPIKNI